MEEEHKYQREMEKRDLERRAQVRKDGKGHNSLKKEELSLLTETGYSDFNVLYWSCLHFSWKLEVLLIILEYMYCQMEILRYLRCLTLGIVDALDICKRIWVLEIDGYIVLCIFLTMNGSCTDFRRERRTWRPRYRCWSSS